MRHDLFTPAAQRALAVAARWSAAGPQAALDLPEVLLGLLDEPECRAALVLAEFRIDSESVRRRWPTLVESAAANPDRQTRFAPGLVAAVRAAESLLFEYPRPLVLATEQVLLGILAAPSEASQWLGHSGLELAALEAEIHRFAGHRPGPLPWIDDDDEIEAATTNNLALANDPSSAELEAEFDAAEPISVSEVALAQADELIALSKNLADDEGPFGEWLEFSGQLEVALPRGNATEPAQTSRNTLDNDTTGVWRILDAAANRAGEGLRVVEDYVRMVLDDRHLTGLCKSLRHELTGVLAALPEDLRAAARDTQADVGVGITLSTEQSRASLHDVVAANFKRLQQSLRSLEEFAKLAQPPAAAAIEQLRYRTYTLQRAVDLTHDSMTRLAEARLYVLVDGRASEHDLAELVTALVAAGVDLLQLRDKTLGDRALLARARVVRALTRGTRTLFVMNDRPDLAALCQADGVHLGQDELTVKDARAIVGPRILVGVSTHSIDQARAAVLDGANYLGVGPTFASGTKHFDAFTGLELIRAVSQEIRLPAFAIGGIRADNLDSVLAAGATRVALSGAVVGAAEPASAARELRAKLNRSPLKGEA